MKKLVCLLGIICLPVLTHAKEKEAKATLPDASLSDVKWGEVVNGVAFDKTALAGKVVVVEEWGVNCGPCIASLPELAKMAKSGEKKGLVVVGLERQQSTKDAILKVIEKAKVGYPIMSGGSAPGNTGGIPHACVFDTTGKLIFSGHPADEDFEKSVKKAMREVKDKEA